MKKITLLLSLLLSLAGSTQLSAESCNGSMGNLGFYAASINEDKSVLCQYRYCYYNCTYNSYTIQGYFKPRQSSHWVENNTCYSMFPYDCQFEHDDHRK